MNFPIAAFETHYHAFLAEYQRRYGPNQVPELSITLSAPGLALDGPLYLTGTFTPSGGVEDPPPGG